MNNNFAMEKSLEKYRLKIIEWQYVLFVHLIVQAIEYLMADDSTVEIWEWISNFIPHFTGCVITYPCGEHS